MVIVASASVRAPSAAGDRGAKLTMCSKVFELVWPINLFCCRLTSITVHPQSKAPGLGKVLEMQTQILFHAHGYQRAWEALKQIGMPEDRVVYQELEMGDLVVVKDITNAKRYGQGSDRLAWFWRIGPNKDAVTGKWMEECKLNYLILFFSSHIDLFSLPC